jgi:putative ABC transport system permease protein
VLLFGMAPAVRSSWIAPAGALNELRRGVSAGLRAGRLRQGLVAAQVALSVVLLVGAGVMLRSFLNLQNSDLGFQARNVLTFRVALPPTRYPDAAHREQFFAKMRDVMRGIPGLRGVATTTGVPLEGGWWRAVQRAGEASTRPGDLLITYHTMVSPGYFAALGIPLKNGRDFTELDSTQNPVVIVSEKLASMKWPGRNPIGQQVRIDPFLKGEPWRTVVGVVGDIRAEGPRRPAPPAIYVPEAYEARPNVTVVMNSEIAPSFLAGEARHVVKSLDAELPVYSMRSVKDILSRVMWRSRLYTALFTAFGAIAVLLATVGLSGIMAHVVIERTHEIGVRMALGATARDVVRMIVSRAFVLAGVGALAGLVAALVATRSLGALLFEVRPGDPVTIMFVLAVLLLAAMAATWIPARRAARIDPAGALRWE